MGKNTILPFHVYIVLRRDPPTGHLYEDLDTIGSTPEMAKSKCMQKDKANESNWKVTPKPESIGKFLVTPLFKEEQVDVNGTVQEVSKESIVPMG